MAMAVQQQPNDNDSEGVRRQPEEQGTGRRQQPNNNNSEGVWRQPVYKGKQPPGFSKSSRKSASVAKGTLRKLGAIGDREARGESEDSKRAAECLGRGRAQQVVRTMSMEHH